MALEVYVWICQSKTAVLDNYGYQSNFVQMLKISLESALHLSFHYQIWLKSLHLSLHAMEWEGVSQEHREKRCI